MLRKESSFYFSRVERVLDQTSILKRAIDYDSAKIDNGIRLTSKPIVQLLFMINSKKYFIVSDKVSCV